MFVMRSSVRFRCMIEDCWWTGEIVSKSAYSNEFPSSSFMCYEVRWDNGEFERMSPWDLEPVNEDSKCMLVMWRSYIILLIQLYLQ